MYMHFLLSVCLQLFFSKKRADHLNWGRSHEVRICRCPWAKWGMQGKVSCFQSYKRCPDAADGVKRWQRCPGDALGLNMK